MHWYNRKGEPAYEVPYAGGIGKRATTLRDARKLDLVPSVTTVGEVIRKPAIEYWNLSQLVLAIQNNFELVASSVYNGTDWGNALISQSKNASKEAAELGTEIHNALEKFYESGEMSAKHTDIINAVDDLLKQEFSKSSSVWVCEPEVAFAHEEGFGGKVDLKACLVEDNGKLIHAIIDFKTKSKDDLTGTLAYDEHCMQLAAYRLGLKLPDASCYNLFISTTSPGVVALHKWTEAELDRGLEMFRHALHYWQALNKYDTTIKG